MAQSRSARYFIARSALTVLALLLSTATLATSWSPMVLAWVLLTVVTLLSAATVWGLKRAGLIGVVASLVALAIPVAAMVLVGRSAGRDLSGSLTDPFPELLTTPAPAPITASLILPGLVLAWLVGIIVGLSAGHEAGRKVGVVGGLASGLILYLAAQLLSGGEADEYGLIGAGLVLTWLADWSLWNRVPTQESEPSGEPQHTPRDADSATPGSMIRPLVVAVVFALVAAGGALINLGPPFQPQELIEREDTMNQEPNPMPLVSHWASEPETEIFRRSGDLEALHLAVLTEYDGVTFRPPERPYDRVGDARPATPPMAGSQRVVRTNVVWPQQMRWLPAPGQPNIVSLPDAEVNANTGTLINREIPAEGALSYSVTSVVSDPDMQQIRDAPVPDLPDYTSVPRLPEELRSYGEELVSGAQSPYEKAVALEKGIKNKRHFTSELPAGNSYGRLRTFLLASEADGGRAGTSEQFAVAFAVLARSQGLPTRVVIGFGPGTPEAPDGSAAVHGSDALAWPEVYFQGQGWVAFNPTPDTEEISPVAADQPEPDNPGVDEQPETQQKEKPKSQEQEQGSSAWFPFLVPLLVVVLILGGLLAARAVRRRKQAARGVVGAWARVVDAVGLSGGRMPANLTAVQRARQLGDSHRAAAERVAAAAEWEAFAPDAQSDGLVDRAFDDADAVEQALRSESSWWRRMTWAFTPQPFFRRWR